MNVGYGVHPVVQRNKGEEQRRGISLRSATIIRQSSRSASNLFLLTTTKSQTLSNAAKSKTAEQFVDAQTTKDAVDQTAQAESIEQLAHETQDTGQQQSNRSDNLEQRLGKQSPQRVQLLLRVRHVRDSLLGVVDGLDHGRGKFLEALSDAVLLRGCFARSGASLGLSSNVPIGVKTANGAVAFAQDAATLFDKWLDVLYEFLFVELLARGAVGFLDFLRSMNVSMT